MKDLLSVKIDELPYFSYVKTLIMYYNSIWCSKIPTTVTYFLKYSYPYYSTAKVKYFRGNMQNWKALELTTVNL